MNVPRKSKGNLELHSRANALISATPKWPRLIDHSLGAVLEEASKEVSDGQDHTQIEAID